MKTRTIFLVGNWAVALVLLLLLGGEAALLKADNNVRPNILFAISDDQSWEHASAYGCQFIKTPNFDRVARAGVLFNNSFCASPGCSPSRASILTGRYPWQLEQAGTHASSFPKKYAVYPDLLEKSGYHVGFTGKGWGPGKYAASGRTRNPAGPDFNKIKTKHSAAKGISTADYAANFEAFLKSNSDQKPFCFWYGAREPHRVFEPGSGVAAGKRLEDVVVPKFLPDSPEIRSDLLDYGLEIEWFDQHLGRMIELLEKSGELENTLIVVTSDNGMAFPRAKANAYEYGIHMPLAICWPAKIPGGRIVDDLVSHTDFAPTFLEAANVDHASSKAPEMIGQSLLPLLVSKEAGTTSFARPEVYSCRERHSSSRWNNWTYPQRCVRTADHLLIRNFKPERYPAGAPRKFENEKDKSEGELGPEHGGYHDIDACPSLTFLIKHRDNPAVASFFNAAVGHRPEYEMFDIKNDPACMRNVAEHSENLGAASELRKSLNSFLSQTGEPRLEGKGEIWESYKRYSGIRSFPKPEWAND